MGWFKAKAIDEMNEAPCENAADALMAVFGYERVEDKRMEVNIEYLKEYILEGNYFVWVKGEKRDCKARLYRARHTSN